MLLLLLLCFDFDKIGGNPDGGVGAFLWVCVVVLGCCLVSGIVSVAAVVVEEESLLLEVSLVMLVVLVLLLLLMPSKSLAFCSGDIFVTVLSPLLLLLPLPIAFLLPPTPLFSKEEDLLGIDAAMDVLLTDLLRKLVF